MSNKGRYGSIVVDNSNYINELTNFVYQNNSTYDLYKLKITFNTLKDVMKYGTIEKIYRGKQSKISSSSYTFKKDMVDSIVEFLKPLEDVFKIDLYIKSSSVEYESYSQFQEIKLAKLSTFYNPIFFNYKCSELENDILCSMCTGGLYTYYLTDIEYTFKSLIIIGSYNIYLKIVDPNMRLELKDCGTVNVENLQVKKLYLHNTYIPNYSCFSEIENINIILNRSQKLKLDISLLKKCKNLSVSKQDSYLGYAYISHSSDIRCKNRKILDTLELINLDNINIENCEINNRLCLLYNTNVKFNQNQSVKISNILQINKNKFISMCKFLLFVTGTYEDYNNNINDIHRRCIENINENSKSAIKYRDIAGGENPSLTASYVKNYIKFQKITKFML